MSYPQKRSKSTRGEARLLSQLNNNSTLNQAYSSAIAYYTSLKKRFLDQVTTQAIAMDSQLSQRSITELENLVALRGSGEEFEKHSQVMEALEQRIVEFVEGNQKGLQNFTQEFERQAEMRKNADEKELVSIARSILKDSRDLKFINDLLRTQSGGYTSADLFTRYANYFTRVILIKTNRLQKATIARADSLAGYFHELTALKALQNSLYKVAPLGSANVSADIILSANAIDKNAALAELKTMEQSLNQFNGISGTGMSTIDFDKYFQNLNITYFGSQVKLWEAQLNSLSRASGYGVGHRDQLLSQLKNEYGENTKLITDRQNFAFFSQFQRIVLAMGANNIIWSTGQTQTWTCDFIDNMRKSNYFLQFSRNDNNELTAYVKWGQLLNAKSFEKFKPKKQRKR